VPIAVSDYSHVRITVTDMARSRAFYDAVFGFDIAAEMPAQADAATRAAFAFLYGGVIYKVGNAAFGLRPVASGDDSFSENRTGLDHLSFAVNNIAELERAASLLDELGVAHGAIKDLGAAGIAILEFRDPDNIALELTAPNS
jgi:glyoxylase I family protein